MAVSYGSSKQALIKTKKFFEMAKVSCSVEKVYFIHFPLIYEYKVSVEFACIGYF